MTAEARVKRDAEESTEADPDNDEWLLETIYKKYDIPYSLFEFVENSYPRDK